MAVMTKSKNSMEQLVKNNIITKSTQDLSQIVTKSVPIKRCKYKNVRDLLSKFAKTTGISNLITIYTMDILFFGALQTVPDSFTTLL